MDEDGKSFFGTGLFAAGARDPDKIIQKQQDALKKLPALCNGKTPGMCLAKYPDGLVYDFIFSRNHDYKFELFTNAFLFKAKLIL